LSEFRLVLLVVETVVEILWTKKLGLKGWWSFADRGYKSPERPSWDRVELTHQQ